MPGENEKGKEEETVQIKGFFNGSQVFYGAFVANDLNIQTKQKRLRHWNTYLLKIRFVYTLKNCLTRKDPTVV